MEKTINKFKSQRLRITLSIMVLTFCTVFLFLSNSAQAQITVTNVEGVNADGTNGIVIIPLASGQTNVYEISNVDQLRALSKYVAESHNCGGLTFNLTADIDFTTLPAARNLVYPIRGEITSASNFVPIGSHSVSTSDTTNTYSSGGSDFAGAFNGNNHTIKGLRIFAANSPYVGFFGWFGYPNYDGPIKNIGIIDANITGKYVVGGLCGELYNCDLDNCYVKNSTINATSYDGSSNTYLGGLIGNYTGGTISNCYVDSTIVSGVGYYVGGLVGDGGTNVSSNCHVKNSTIIGKRHLGGLAGITTLGLTKTNNCSVESTTIRSIDNTNEAIYAGGFIGSAYIYGLGGTQNITNCYVKSVTIEGLTGYYYGGFIGWANTNISVYTPDNTHIGFQNCYVTGTADNPTVIKGTTSNYSLGGVSGFVAYMPTASTNNTTTIVKCYVTFTSLYGQSGTSGFMQYISGIVHDCYTTAILHINTSTPSYNFSYSYSSPYNYSNNYYYNGTASTNGTASNGVTGLSSTRMKSSDFITTLNSYSTGLTTNYTADYTPFPVNGGYPIFNGAPAASLTVPYTVGKGEEIIIPEGTLASAIPSNITISDGGSLIDNSGNVSSVTIQRKLKVGAWNLFGLTQSTTTNVGILNNNAGTVSNKAHDMAAVQYDYTATGNTWNTGHYLGVNEAAGYNSMNIGEGYFVWPLRGTHDNPSETAGDANDLGDTYTIVSQTEAPYTSDIPMTTLNLTNSGAATTGNTVNGIWFSLNNPYTGKLSPNEICTSTSISNTQGESTVYTYNADNGAWEVPAYVYPGQGFMVASASDATRLSGTLTKTTRTAKSSETTPSYITFTCQANNTTKEAFARISEQASNGFDQKDAYVLLSSNNENLVEPYFLVENHAVLKNIYKTMPYYTPMNFHASKGSNTNLTVNNIPENVNVSIIDLSNGNETALENGSSFNFVANQGENEGRFVVKFAKNSVGLDNNAEENGISLAMYPNPATTSTTLFIDGLTNDAQVSVCDVQGRSINNYTLNTKQSTLKINTSNLASGVYYIRVVSNNLTKTEKLIVK